MAVETGCWTVPGELAGRRLDAAVRALSGASWSAARRWVARGKVRIDGTRATDATQPVRAGAVIVLDVHAPGPRAERLRALGLVHLDAAVVVVDKPAGVSTVPYGDEPPGEAHATLDALVRALLARKLGSRGRPPLGVVHRIDKETSGLVVFARTLAAKRRLAAAFRRHDVHRLYLAIAHGRIDAAVLRSRLVRDRGDGLRGSTSDPRRGELAVTHVRPREALAGATLVACRLETGRTHQIRVHLSEMGHAIVGERVYVRDHDGARIAAPRLMLHAAELGFAHPTSGEPMRFRSPLPEDFAAVLAALRR
jgi:23S rRNA pseudouridine1911/1915/1917 synthase